MKKSIRMKVSPDCYDEYKVRHDALWPEMRKMLKGHGCTSYSIWLDKETGYLFGYLEIENEKLFDEASKTAINQKWWDYMADIMETNEDNSPVSINLEQVFDL